MAFEWDITEPLPFNLGGRTAPSDQTYKINAEAIDIAIGNLPFLVYPNDEHPYERSTAQWRKDQFDSSAQVGEQSLTGWWLRSQTDFSGGAGITFFEPLLGEGSETRFIDSRGVDVFSKDAVRLLRRMVNVRTGAGDDVECSGLGLGYTLYRNSGNFFRIGASGAATQVTPLGNNPRGIARISGNSWLIGHDTGISRMYDSGATADVITGATAPLRPFWAKDRIIAAQGHKLYQLTLSSGSIDESTAGAHFLHQSSITQTEWVDVASTPGAIWAAGVAFTSSSIVAFSVDDSGDIPTINSAPVRLVLPQGETINALSSYSDLLLICTNKGFRLAVTDGAMAQLGPLLWEDEASHSAVTFGDYVWVGVEGGKTRKVYLAGVLDDLTPAWANDAEAGEGGRVLGLGWAFNRLVMAVEDLGALRQHDTQLVGSGYIDLGFARFGTLEKKRFQSVKLIADSTFGSIGVSAASAWEDEYAPVTSLDTWKGSREIDLHLPGSNPPVEKMSLRIILNRDPSDSTRGPTFEGYQLRALPAPERRQRMISVPLKCYEFESDRFGNRMGGPGFAWNRLRALESLENSGLPTIYKDFRTGESKTVIVDQVGFTNLSPPARESDNFGGWIQVILRTID